MLSIIIPVYNNAALLKTELPALLGWLQQNGCIPEIVLVDDGSADRKAAAQVAAQYKCRHIALKHNMGKGAAVRQGVLAASGSEIIFTDADIPFSYESLLHMATLLKEGKAGMAAGDRTLNESLYFTEISRKRVWGSSVFSTLVEWFIHRGLNDTQCGLKGFTRTAANKIFHLSRINSFAFDVELFCIAHSNNMPVARIPVTLRSNDSTTVSFRRHAWRMLFDLLRIRWFLLTKKYKS